MILKRVVFPVPFDPTSATRSPSFIVNEISSSMTSTPKLFFILFIAIDIIKFNLNLSICDKILSIATNIYTLYKIYIYSVKSFRFNVNDTILQGNNSSIKQYYIIWPVYIVRSHH